MFVVGEVGVVKNGEGASAAHRHGLDGVLVLEVAQSVEEGVGLLGLILREGGGPARVREGRAPLVHLALLVVIDDAIHARGESVGRR